MVAAENNPDGNPNDYFTGRTHQKRRNPFADNMIDDPDTGSDKTFFI
ncbi:MAG: hypothetical protein IPH69_16425 [Bacteroidales bacterium]|nr:hypothetical protein [Bacteroidales bacterium]